MCTGWDSDPGLHMPYCALHQKCLSHPDLAYLQDFTKPSVTACQECEYMITEIVSQLMC